MTRIKVVTDSSSDLPEEVRREFGIEIVPLTVTFGEQVYEDLALSADEFWDLAKGSQPPKTSQPPIGAFYRVFKLWVDQGYEVLCTTLTGRLSGTYSSACHAAQSFESHVTVVDSRSLSWGLGWQAIKAAKMAVQGASIGQIVEALHSLRERTHFVIQLDTLEYLRRGGRGANVMPLIDRFAKALQIKPLVDIVEGQIGLVGVARSYQKGIERIKAEAQHLGALEALAVMHTRRLAVAQKLADELARLTNLAREQIVVGEAGSVLCSHGGDGIIATVAIKAG